MPPLRSLFRSPSGFLRTYAHNLRQRLVCILFTTLIVFALTAIYTFSRTKLYQSSAVLLRTDPTSSGSHPRMESDGLNCCEIELNSYEDVLRSQSMSQKIAERITGEDLRQFMAPYRKDNLREPVTPVEVLTRNLKVSWHGDSMKTEVSYRHPDRQIAARVANLFVDEFINGLNENLQGGYRAIQFALHRAEQAHASVAQTIKEAHESNRLDTNYEELNRQLLISQENLSALKSRADEYSKKPIEPLPIRILNRATPAIENDYAVPNVPLYLSAGAIGGLLLGIGLATSLSLIAARPKK